MQTFSNLESDGEKEMEQKRVKNHLYLHWKTISYSNVKCGTLRHFHKIVVN